MQLKNAASLLMVGSILLILQKLVWLFYMFFLGMLFFGMLSSNIQSVVAILAGVVGIVLAVSFRKGMQRSVSRMTSGIFLAIVSGLWTVVSLLTTYDYIEWLPMMGNYGLLALSSHIVFLLACVSLLLMGIALSGNNGLRLRRACIWVIICCGLSALITLAASAYAVATSRSENVLDLMLMLLEIAGLLFPVAWMVMSFALLRVSRGDGDGVQHGEF